MMVACRFIFAVFFGVLSLSVEASEPTVSIYVPVDPVPDPLGCLPANPPVPTLYTVIFETIDVLGGSVQFKRYSPYDSLLTAVSASLTATVTVSKESVVDCAMEAANTTGIKMIEYVNPSCKMYSSRFNLSASTCMEETTRYFYVRSGPLSAGECYLPGC